LTLRHHPEEAALFGADVSKDGCTISLAVLRDAGKNAFLGRNRQD